MLSPCRLVPHPPSLNSHHRPHPLPPSFFLNIAPNPYTLSLITDRRPPPPSRTHPPSFLGNTSPVIPRQLSRVDQPSPSLPSTFHRSHPRRPQVSSSLLHPRESSCSPSFDHIRREPPSTHPLPSVCIPFRNLRHGWPEPGLLRDPQRSEPRRVEGTAHRHHPVLCRLVPGQVA